MFSIFLVALLPLIFIPVVLFLNDPNGGKLLRVLVLAYFARIFWWRFLSDLPFFSYGAGGDANYYEMLAEVITKIWQHDGIHYITRTEFPPIGRTSLPINLFAFVIHMGGVDGGRMGSTAIVAACACLTAVNFYRLAIELGATPRVSFRATCVLLFMPAFFMYTADVYKDGFVLFFLMTAFSSAVRLSRKVTLLHAVVGALACWGLWGCRFYMVFIVLTPLIVGFIGIGSKSVIRKVLGIALLIGIFMALVFYTGVLEGAENEAETGYAAGIRGIRFNAKGGSGVTFDDEGDATGALHWKVLYTLFSPFPWMTGSIALHLGKIEALIWYYFCYRAFIAARRLFNEDRGLFAMFITFLVPTTLMYSLVMSNVGLIVRERIAIVVVGMLLGTLSWTPSKAEKDRLAAALREREAANARGAIAAGGTQAS